MFNAQINKLSIFANSILQGDYSSTIIIDEFTGKNKIIAQCINNLKHQLLEYTFETQVVSDQITAVTNRMEVSLQNNEQHFNILNNQSIQLNHLNTLNQDAVEQTVDSSEHIQEILKKSSTITNTLLENSMNSQATIKLGLDEIYGIINIIDSIAQSNMQTSDNIDQLKNSFNEIQNILKTVEGFAKQTHLLSLNASIESARAGEYGKGFGVVASEIRNLAEESNSAVTNISNLIETIYYDVNQVTEQNALNSNKVEDAVAHTNNIQYHLNKIEDSFEMVQGGVKDIVEMSKSEKDLLNKIREAILKMKDTSDATTESFNQIFRSIREQNEQVIHMKQLEKALNDSAGSLITLTQKSNLNILENNMTQINELANSLLSWLNEMIMNICHNNTFDIKNPSLIKEQTDDILNANDKLEAIWVNDISGSFVYSNPPAGIANANVREWFQESIKGKEFISSTYISAISKNPCVTVSFPVYSHNKIIAVVGADINIKIISSEE
ncbi:methyl-accepting chemotaxis sensory transducer with Cache sensor [Natranaerovirga pectinivora]|uniref:Methyl-accepting chemotaxis sensory transducer with Cache sensor n=1 Tax=Natranaerovirga pectinivora TaxID=682400 RepID=A0A4R3MKD0_9FIRM|nr:methyl-accepting chemotaxis protein [Natranaerovirga pectinivora]TCT14281.1 methyl-accepting chemotaxis sensory transducer with Cache sensor [Natranaerovirga pectinivora]